MGEIEPISGAGGAKGVNKLMSNVLLDMFQQTLAGSGLQTSPETRNALQELRDVVNGNQHQAAQQVQGGQGGDSPAGTEGAGGPESAGAPQGQGQDGMSGLMQMLMQLMQMIVQLMSQMQQQQGGGGASPGASSFAQQLPQGGGPLDDFGDGDEGLDDINTMFDPSQMPQQLM